MPIRGGLAEIRRHTAPMSGLP